MHLQDDEEVGSAQGRSSFGCLISWSLSFSRQAKWERFVDSTWPKVLTVGIAVLEMTTSIFEEWWEGGPYLAIATAVCFSAYTWLKVYAHGWLFFHGKVWHKVEVLFSTAHLVLVLTTFANEDAISKRAASAYYNVLLAPIMVCNSRTLRHTMSVVTQVCIDTASSLLFLMFLLLIYGYFGCIMYEHSFSYDTTVEVRADNYGSLGSGFLSTFVLLTTENYPSIMVQPWKESPANVLYFMSFVFFSVLLQAYLLGKVDDAFTHNLMKSVRYHYSKELRGYAYAFLAITTLDPEPGKPEPASLDTVDISSLSISPEQWRSLVHRFSKENDEKANLLADVTFFFRDKDASGDIDLKEFLSLAELLKYEIREDRGRDYLGRAYKTAPQKVMEHWAFLSLSAVNIIVTSLLLLSHATGEARDEQRFGLVVCFIIFYGEVILRLCATGPTQYIKGWYDVVEALVVLISIGSLVIPWAANGDFRISYRHCAALVLRSFCLFREALWKPSTLLWWLDRLMPCLELKEGVASTNLRARESFDRTIALFLFMGGGMFFIVYFFAVLGMCLIGDALAATDSLPSATMNGDYGEMTNFSNLPRSLVSMFQILMTNNWNDILYTAMQGSGASIALFFVVFYILSVLVMLNIFTSIVLQSINKREGAGLLPKHVGAHKVRMQGITYTLDRKGSRRGLELHMELVDSTKEQLLQECLEQGIFNRVIERTQKELLSRQAFLTLIGMPGKAGKTIDPGLERLALALARNPEALWETPEGGLHLEEGLEGSITLQGEEGDPSKVPSMGNSFGKITLAEVQLGQDAVVRT